MVNRWTKWLCIAAALGIATPAQAFFRVKEETVTPQMAQERRTDAQEAARALQKIGDPVSAGIRLDEGAAHWGDPVLYLDAAEMYFEAAKEKRDVAYVHAGIERASIATDILYFHLDSGSDRDFRMVATGELPGLIARANELHKRGEQLIDEVELGESAPEENAEEPEKKKKKRRKGKADKALFISGAGLTAVGGALLVMGVAGLGLGAARQNEAERPDTLGVDYDAVAQKGRKANVMAGVGFGLGGAAVIAGVTLILVSKARGKKKKRADDDKMVRLSPAGGPAGGGLVLNGRF
jgi:hypothetical protein